MEHGDDDLNPTIHVPGKKTEEYQKRIIFHKVLMEPRCLNKKLSWCC